jgi:ribosomal protein S18 acetylase RimI-like enzyme
MPAELREPSTERLAVVAEVMVRPCREEDLQTLEWFGLHSHHREIFVDTFARHLSGENIMLVADLNDFPVGQAWVDLIKRQSERVGYIWAVRVFPFLRGLGIGTYLMRSAEELLRVHGFNHAEVGVEKDNEAARRFYVRLGYLPHGELTEEYSYTTPEGVHAHHIVDQWIMRKSLVDVSDSA